MRSLIVRALAASQVRAPRLLDLDACETICHHGVAALQALDGGDAAGTRWHLCCALAVARGAGLGEPWSRAVRAVSPQSFMLS